MADYRKKLNDEYSMTLKKRVDSLNEQAEKDHSSKINGLKDAFIKEMKSLKDQLVVFRNQLKAKEKLVLKLTRILQKQEHQLGSEDYTMYLELDRPMELNMMDMNKLK